MKAFQARFKFTCIQFVLRYIALYLSELPSISTENSTNGALMKFVCTELWELKMKDGHKCSLESQLHVSAFFSYLEVSFN